jgi:signal transduction histidine kinase
MGQSTDTGAPGCTPPAANREGGPLAGCGGAADAGTWGPGSGPVRRWLARELHDGVVQTLTTMVIDLEQLKREHSGVGILPRLETLQGWTRSALRDLRDLLREVRGEPCDVHDFEVQVAALVCHVETATGARCRLATSASWPPVLPAHLAVNLYRIVEEALRNVARHSGAHNVVVRLDAVDGHLSVTVADDGTGVEDPPPARRPQGMGVLGMRERAALVGGRLSIITSPGGGTTVTAVLDPRPALPSPVS